MKQTQYHTVLKHLRYYKTISTWEAFQEYGITRLSAIIFNLRRDGYNIGNETKSTITRLGNKTSYTNYTLQSEQ